MNAVDGVRNLVPRRRRGRRVARRTSIRGHVSQDGTLISGLVGCAIFRMNVEPLLRAGDGQFDAEFSRASAQASAVPAYRFDWGGSWMGSGGAGRAIRH